ncbi:MAG: transglutaminase domain-containing protein [Bacteriovoracaceae bacterium]|nr:transglutaminase domain-containing protein [Bacteriovoracaceae bacterium]
MIRIYLIACVALFISACSPSGPVKSRHGVVTISIDMTEKAQGQSAALWILRPLSDATQKISIKAVTGSYDNHIFMPDTKNKTEYLYATWSAEKKEKVLSFSFEAEAKEITMTNLRDSGLPLPKEIEPYLVGTKYIPIDGVIAEIAKKAVAGKTSILEKARAIYDWTVENTKRDPNVRGCGLGIVERTITIRSGKCADISSVYVALARSVGVASREVFGLRLGNKDKQNMTGGYHCWAEFYLPGTGWVPVDPSDVRKFMLKNNKTLDEVKELREYFFGSVDQYRVALKRGGRGVTLVPQQKDAPVNYLMYPYAEVNGKALDYFEPKDFKYSVDFTAL